MRFGDSGPLTEHRAMFRVVLLALALPQLAIGVWALADPEGWFEDFPGGGSAWLPVYGPYNEHLAVDAGAALFATSMLLIFGALTLQRRAVQVALGGWLSFAIPHTAYHLATLGRYESGDAVANTVTLTATVLLPAGLLWLTLDRAPRERGTPRRDRGEPGTHPAPNRPPAGPGSTRTPPG